LAFSDMGANFGKLSRDKKIDLCSMFITTAISM